MRIAGNHTSGGMRGHSGEGERGKQSAETALTPARFDPLTASGPTGLTRGAYAVLNTLATTADVARVASRDVELLGRGNSALPFSSAFSGGHDHAIGHPLLAASHPLGRTLSRRAMRSSK
jgi:hypothetical protein